MSPSLQLLFSGRMCLQCLLPLRIVPERVGLQGPWGRIHACWTMHTTRRLQASCTCSSSCTMASCSPVWHFNSHFEAPAWSLEWPWPSATDGGCCIRQVIRVISHVWRSPAAGHVWPSFRGLWPQHAFLWGSQLCNMAPRPTDSSKYAHLALLLASLHCLALPFLALFVPL